jgi:RNA polymerase sigma-70 factor, ECF subfamily
MVELLAEEGTSHRIDQEIDRERLIKALDNMDYKYKEILELRFLEDKNYQEISDILKKPAGTVASLLNRAKSKLAEEITKQQ